MDQEAALPEDTAAMEDLEAVQAEDQVEAAGLDLGAVMEDLEVIFSKFFVK